MKHITYKLLLFFLLTFFINVFSTEITYSQSGMRFAEFNKRLELYFHPDLIADIKAEMPKGDFLVWGWDVGDFSGDGNNDVAFSIRRSGLKERVVDVYLFVDIEGYLTKVDSFPFTFVEMPLEVGVAIRNNTCFVTKKLKQYNWDIKGFRFINGVLVNYDNYSTRKLNKITYETYRNYYKLFNTDRYLNTAKGGTILKLDYLTIPSYSRGRLIYDGITQGAYSNYIEFVPEGAYWLSDSNDLSFEVKSAYDSEYLYFTINVKDDYVVTPFCDTCVSESIEVWLDVHDYLKSGERIATIQNETPLFNNKAKTGIYKFEIRAGNFVTQPATIIMSSSDELNSMQKLAALNSNVVCDISDSGYYAILKIPFAALGRTEPPIKEDTIVEWGCAVRVIDYDNEFREEEKTVMDLSAFVAENPSSYASLLFIPDEKTYGEIYNIMQGKVIEYIKNIGF
ncbi:MAG: hypothetical protein IJK61_07915 [Bacteroidetes bacterium]|nr:hypothetical protein [Bacteroidota bacterium]MBR3091377.1 hypothetical protein [Bacteroidota bacterium]